MSPPSAEKFALLLGLSFFLGLAFEGFYWKSAPNRPGGIRTFPLISLLGGLLYTIEPHYAAAFCAGLFALAAWMYPYYRAQFTSATSNHANETNIGFDESRGDGIMVPVCNLAAYVLGPVTLVEPPWVAIGFTVSAVLLLRARDQLHAIAQKVPAREIITAGEFLVLTGIVLPLLPNEPITKLSTITPFQVWLAVVAVSTLSYGSYLVQKFLPPERGLLLSALVGGLYSSTATTVVLARQLDQHPADPRELQAGIVLATAMMYLRLGLVIAIFNLPLAIELAPALGMLFVAALGLAILCMFLGSKSTKSEEQLPAAARNPLELNAAMIFAVMFVAISVASTWVKAHFGAGGIYSLAAIIGVTDIDPFVLNLAQGGVGGLTSHVAVIAILIASSSNNLLKGLYSILFAGHRAGAIPLAALVVLALFGLAMAAQMAGMLG
jgi:uncharacterized membrane protein (DUF4010 family)